MHVLLALLGAVGAVAALIWRVRMMGDAAREVADAAKTVANAPRRMRFQSRAKGAGLQAVDDPREAAAVLMALVGRVDGDLSSDAKTAIADHAAQRFELSQEDAHALAAQAAWLTRDAANADAVIDRMVALLQRTVTDTELIELEDMLRAVVGVAGAPTTDQAALLDRYRRKAQL